MADKGTAKDAGAYAHAMAPSSVSIPTLAITGGGLESPSASFVLALPISVLSNRSEFPNPVALPTIQFRSGKGFFTYGEALADFQASGQLWPRGDK